MTGSRPRSTSSPICGLATLCAAPRSWSRRRTRWPFHRAAVRGLTSTESSIWKPRRHEPMPVVNATRTLEPRSRRPIGWDGRSLHEMLTEQERLFAETGRYWGLEQLPLQRDEPIRYEKMFSRLRGGLVSARETALNISASPIVTEIGELSFMLYTPEGDSIALSRGIIVHVHTASDAIKYMIRQGYEDDPGINPGDIFCNNDATIGDVHNADVLTIVPIFWEEELIGWAA